ncbi:MAG: hypothetical protein WC313_07045, partial [Candidatus Kapaibacterium sp.]
MQSYSLDYLTLTVLIVCFIISPWVGTLAQNKEDSLLRNYRTAVNDSTKISSLVDLANHYIHSSPMKAQPYIDELRSIALRTDDENALIGSDNMQALIYNESSNIDSANKIFEKYVNDIDIVKDKTMA